MIIIYEDKCSFQRCGYKDGSDEYYYDTLDELYTADLIDGIVLQRDRDKICSFECGCFEVYEYWKDFEMKNIE